MQRLKYTLASLLTVLAAYWTYALAAVPFIEPAVVVTQPTSSGRTRPAMAQNERLAQWFGPDDWELQQAKILETKQGLLVLQNYKIQDQKLLRIWPCTMVFLPARQPGQPPPPPGRAIILKSEEGALLEFDAALDLKQGKLGNLVGGKLLGEVTIHSDQRDPGPDDDLDVRTREVELKGNRIWTPHRVDFRLGANQGHGSRLEALLEQAVDDARQQAPQYTGLHSLTLHREVWMRAVLKGDLIGGKDEPAERTARTAAEADQPPVVIECAGSFEFNLAEQRATFLDRVNVIQEHFIGPSDQLNCERLDLFLTEAADETDAVKPQRDDDRPNGQLEFRGLKASGYPVVFRGPSRGIQARGEVLEWDEPSRTLSLHPAPASAEGPALGDR